MGLAPGSSICEIACRFSSAGLRLSSAPSASADMPSNVLWLLSLESVAAHVCHPLPKVVCNVRARFPMVTSAMLMTAITPAAHACQHSTGCSKKSGAIKNGLWPLFGPAAQSLPSLHDLIVVLPWLWSCCNVPSSFESVSCVLVCKQPSGTLLVPHFPGLLRMVSIWTAVQMSAHVDQAAEAALI